MCELLYQWKIVPDNIDLAMRSHDWYRSPYMNSQDRSQVKLTRKIICIGMWCIENSVHLVGGVFSETRIRFIILFNVCA